MSSPNIFQRLVAYALPSVFFQLSLICHVYTAVLHPILLLTNLDSFREKAFANLWFIGGAVCAIDTPAALSPLLAKSSGVILDLGPGSGHQLFRFSKPKEIQAIYGAEPGVSMHKDLEWRAKQAGLGDKYHILNCEAQMGSLGPALRKAGMLKDGGQPFDEIVCIRVLCGVSHLDHVVWGLYNFLKPGGKMIVCEHVINTGDSAKNGTVLGRSIQHFHMNIGWRPMMGGCELTRDTMGSLLKAAAGDGGWEKVDVEVVDPWSTIPHIVGTLVKRK